MADENADVHLQLLTPDDTGSGERDKLTTAAPPFTRRLGYPVEITDVEKAETDLPPSQKDIHENNPETSELPKSHWWRTTIPLGLAFIAIAVGSEVLFKKTHKSGFRIKLTYIDPSHARQFLKSFGPAMIFTLLFHWFTAPYVTKLIKPYEQNRKRLWVVSILPLIVAHGGIFHSLAGAYFQIIVVPRPQEARVRIAGKTGWGYDNVEFTPFVDAAGFVGAVSRIGALYSPFILNDTTSKTGNTWVVPSFTLADPSAADQDGEVNLTFRGLSVQARCAPVPSPVISGPDTTDSYDISGTLSHNCSATSNVISNGTTWDSWMVPAPFGCVRSIDPGNNHPIASNPLYFSPVAFSFLKNISSYSMVFCYSMIEEHDLTVTLAIDSGTPFIYDVVDRGNVSFLSWGPSGIGWTSSDPRVEGIGDAISFALAGSIVNSAGLDEIGGEIDTSLQDGILRDANSVVGYAEEAVRLFQATLAPSTLIVGPSYLRNATRYVETYNLVAYAPAAHVLTALCAIVGSILIALSIHHFWRRKELLANAAPSATTTTAPTLAS
ncbi:uncharacterized protein EI90DRAFT_3162278 [Cantharellus anzutake]|uniref:uncharacterized protein n=1 Tax=Cantharellus anzutake TaxID=1750568 RepID=UPI001902E7DD|nr:uncharacterized protein EI90DRAFT_3162278 [Cantharellus anzutake]KAF8308921.1 hypothetical protein EI90DRAFT_3162278 [Cantharellus anzutake]